MPVFRHADDSTGIRYLWDQMLEPSEEKDEGEGGVSTEGARKIAEEEAGGNSGAAVYAAANSGHRRPRHCGAGSGAPLSG